MVKAGDKVILLSDGGYTFREAKEAVGKEVTVATAKGDIIGVKFGYFNGAPYNLAWTYTKGEFKEVSSLSEYVPRVGDKIKILSRRDKLNSAGVNNLVTTGDIVKVTEVFEGRISQVNSVEDTSMWGAQFDYSTDFELIERPTIEIEEVGFGSVTMVPEEDYDIRVLDTRGETIEIIIGGEIAKLKRFVDAVYKAKSGEEVE